jgi:DNA polymerase I-like protein with 3'-5' exonuclease and polymerase domains
VHDENVTEPLIRPDNEKVLEQVMAERSDWAAHLRIPLAIETWSGDRYRN